MIRKSLLLSIVGTLTLGASPAFAVPYLVHMDDVENLLNWSVIDDDIGDLYDSGGTKQIEVTYNQRVTFGNSAIQAGPEFWDSPEYGNYHSAIFAANGAGGSEVLEVEITGLNGNQVSLSDVIVGRWYPDGINTLDSDWWAYDGNWNLLASGNTVMTEYIDYTINLNTAMFDTVRFQLGEDNWDNGLIAFSYDTNVVGTLDLSINGTAAPTPNLPGSGPASVPAPATLGLMLLGLFFVGAGRRRLV